jgi:UDP-N-acetylglucosamine--N-acetylmuramyl-(pentapeptide) pyrophosphoryl-undecaprenol N-acetylglucosamine transferase
MGRANRFMAGRVDRIATGFERLDNVGEAIRRKAERTGNPVRPAVLAAARIPYPSFEDGAFRLVVTGGSQGARVMSDVVPPAIELLPADLRARLVLTQQARAEDAARAGAVYERLGVKAEVSPFFTDLPARIAGAHLVIARSGASTVSELAVIGRPSILVPFPFALDQDQASNAAELAGTGAATVIRQSEFTPQWLATRLAEDFADPEALRQRAQAASRAGAPDAAERLADLVQRIARRDS